MTHTPALGQALQQSPSAPPTVLRGETALDLVHKVRARQVDEAPSLTVNPALMIGHHPKRILVRFAHGCDNLIQQEIHETIGLANTVRNYTACPGLCLVEVDVANYERALSAYAVDDNVIYAEADFRIQISAMPNDAQFDQLWGMENTGQAIGGTEGIFGADIGATNGWDLWTGDPNYRIAVIDTGIDYLHVDLSANMWTNPGEIPNNGIDDDGNGYVDDIHGYNTIGENGDPFDDNGHGTHIAGSIGAVGNNLIGVTGINWRCQLVAIKALDSEGRGFVSDVIEAIEYAINNDINLSNNSYAYDTFSQALSDVIAASQLIDHLFVTVSGNDIGRNIDFSPKYPASFELDNILVATATDSRDVISIIANFGPLSVDVGAPGQQILSTTPGNNYAYLTGTSMAGAYTAGLAALLRSREPGMTALAIKQRIISTTREVASLHGRSVSGGLIDLPTALGDCDRNGILDSVEIMAGAADCNGNNRLDSCEPDCDQDGMIDACAISQQLDTDCNQNNLPDSCELANGFMVDCDANQILDECELMPLTDVNMNGVLDVCESCQVDADCINDNPCMSIRCLANFCESSPLVDTICDDGNICSENDRCQSGECVGDTVPTASCGPLFTGTVSSVNGQFLPGGAQTSITAKRGDVLTIEWFGQRWSPRSIVAYNLLVDSDSLTSGTTGRIGPDISSGGVEGAFINENRADYMFFGVGHISILLKDTIDFLEYIGVVILTADCPVNDDTPAYLGSLNVRVSDTASGTFQICPQETIISLPITFFIECENTTTVSPSEIQCVTIHIPLGDCDQTPDCNNNDIWDVCDIALDTSLDCNRNDIPDDCDLNVDASLDCNHNGIPDECDIKSGIEMDCDNNGVPDFCEPDCNGNGLTDACDILEGQAFDCNNNGTLDVCDIADGVSRDCFDRGNGIPDECEPDCNGNGEADTCDLALGVSVDRDANSIPDDCQSTLLVPSEFRTIAEAIEAATSGDVIVLAPGTYSRNNNLFLDFGGKVLTVKCEGSREDCIIDCDGERFAFELHDDETNLSRIERLTMRNCGAGVSMDRGASVTISNCIIENSYGTAIFGSQSQAVIEDCLITGTTGFSAINFVGSSPTIRRTEIVANSNRGVFSDTSHVDLLNCTIADNGRFRGGGLYFRRSQYTIDHCTIANNFGGSAAALFATDSQVSITNSVIWNHIATIQPIDVSDAISPCVNLLCPSEPAIVVINKSQFSISDSLLDGDVSTIFGDDSSLLSFGQGLIDTGPRFVKASRRNDVYAALKKSDYHLSLNSPCINMGQRSFQWESPDIDLNPRVLFSRTDLGSDEATSYSDCNGNGIPDGQEIALGLSIDCNNNGLPDSCDILAGLSLDDDDNGTPDECEMALTVLAGARYLEVTLDTSNVPVALHVTSPSFDELGCDNSFIGPDQQLQYTPFYQPARAWGNVLVGGPSIQSDTYYSVELWTIVNEQPQTILTNHVQTNLLGDVNSDDRINVRDLFSILQQTISSWDERSLVQFDLAPCHADRVIDAYDVEVVIRGFTSEIDSQPSCAAICP